MRRNRGFVAWRHIAQPFPGREEASPRLAFLVTAAAGRGIARSPPPRRRAWLFILLIDILTTSSFFEAPRAPCSGIPSREAFSGRTVTPRAIPPRPTLIRTGRDGRYCASRAAWPARRHGRRRCARFGAYCFTILTCRCLAILPVCG